MERIETSIGSRDLDKLQDTALEEVIVRRRVGRWIAALSTRLRMRLGLGLLGDVCAPLGVIGAGYVRIRDMDFVECACMHAFSLIKDGCLYNGWLW